MSVRPVPERQHSPAMVSEEMSLHSTAGSEKFAGEFSIFLLILLEKREVLGLWETQKRI